ncbi:MAG: iron chelate uptake ABC transporter family permease subunit [Acidipropionibacterium jensenii]|uniref:FecCD family ABC transporter permease n=2 Tax=Acidipropionibacterium jensenii TaxID=1749 RepID=UPI002649D9C6|nr:iron chelate uptake ABC transporter family permease subunit [Acidipropionibacterium jensenii]MDN5978448.1 iron chelate uptake ABC transporter family permease subunit [Acidipropionibacterium jensenii]MDN6022102.1 iron chelate uptake ABC transporter family permease subunit [Acidipropionibacterium jensenii]MDN6425673.1 iron chelate uptake ABC transporter family permease subunit [Acidipropionibacterium jensenii]MDN6425676.1 iron chelate uptake ABC transporter family permease subunit [Acidipropio
MTTTGRRLPVLPIVILLVVLALASTVVSLAFGSEHIPLGEVIHVVEDRLAGHPISSPFDTIVWDLRLPRALLALIVGAGLSIGGAGMQTLVRNPLADPYLLGISSGASVGATAVITMGLLGRMGSWALSGGALIVVGLGMMAIHNWLDALAAGPETAAALGVRTGALRTGLFVALGILIGALVAVSGGIGFVGLILPHAARILVGATHRRMLPVAAAAGSLFMVWVDVISRVVARPQEIPRGVVTGVIGAPVFLILMGRRKYAFGGRDA